VPGDDRAIDAHLSFNLVDEPWIRVVGSDGSIELVSIRSALHRAHELGDLAGEIPTQDPPILRLLLAVLHRALGGPASKEEWKRLWGKRALPRDPIDRYLDTWKHRFDLFDVEKPFLQTGDLHPPSGVFAPAALLIPYIASGNNVPLFGGRRDDQPLDLAPAEAARWLVHLHAWDVAGIKTGAVGDPNVKGGKTCGNPLGLLGNLGFTCALGETLRDTLLLNLLPGDAPQLMVPEPAHDAPAWEVAPTTPAWSERLPRGLTDLYTWQARRVRLVAMIVEGRMVVREVLVAAGDRVSAADLFRMEPHTAWRRSSRLEKQEKRAPIYLPKLHDPDRQLWRGLTTLLTTAQVVEGQPLGPDAPAELPPSCLNWLAGLVGPDMIALHEVLRVCSVGIHYGTQKAVVTELVSDTVPLPVRLLAQKDSERLALVHNAVAGVEDAATALRALAHNLYRAAGGGDDAQSRRSAEEAARQLYSQVDPRFRRLLRSLAADDIDLDAMNADWQREVRRMALGIADEILQGASPDAFRGRHVVRGADERFVNSAVAERWFRSSLSKALPHAQGDDERVVSAGREAS
jgi:CRISPR system Cascade subunit CasA